MNLTHSAVRYHQPSEVRLARRSLCISKSNDPPAARWTNASWWQVSTILFLRLETSTLREGYNILYSPALPRCWITSKAVAFRYWGLVYSVSILRGIWPAVEIEVGQRTNEARSAEDAGGEVKEDAHDEHEIVSFQI